MQKLELAISHISLQAAAIDVMSNTFQLNNALNGLLAKLEKEKNVEMEQDEDDPRFLKIFSPFCLHSIMNTNRPTESTVSISRGVLARRSCSIRCRRHSRTSG